MAKDESPVSVPPEVQGLLRKFLDGLSVEEKRLEERMALDHDGLVMRVALNELDLHEHFIARESEDPDELARTFLVAGLGFRRLIVRLLELHSDFTYPAITMPRSPTLARKVMDFAFDLGVIEHGRRNVEAVWAGISSIHRLGEGRFRFELPTQILDAEAHERSVEQQFRREFRRHFNGEFFETASARRNWNLIQDLMLENVFVFRDHFMGYNGDGLIDQAFMDLAWQDIEESPQFDAFDFRKTFGGIPYLKYLLGSAIVVSFAHKHERFAALLKVKHPDVKLHDILTISSDRAQTVTDLWFGLNEFGPEYSGYTMTTREEAEQIFSVITLTRGNAAIVSRPYPPLPVIVEFARTSVVTFIGGRTRQMEFMLESLKKNYPRDYSANQRSREASMQRALTELFAEHFPDVVVRTNVNLRIRGKLVTDVDFVAFDPRVGDLMLFQLKYQDCHGVDIKAGTSRMSRFLRESTSWLDAVGQWLAASDTLILKNAFRLPKRANVVKVQKLIVGRHHAYPLAGVALDKDVAFATLMQLFNACLVMRERQGDFRTINGLFEVLRKHVVGAEARHYQREDPVRYRLGQLEYEIVQLPDPTAA